MRTWDTERFSCPRSCSWEAEEWELKPGPSLEYLALQVILGAASRATIALGNTCGWNECAPTTNDGKNRKVSTEPVRTISRGKCRTKQCLPRVSGNQSHNLPKINTAWERSGPHQGEIVWAFQILSDNQDYQRKLQQHLEAVLKSWGRG